MLMTFLANTLAWLSSCGAWVLFVLQARRLRHVQTRLLARILRDARDTRYGSRHEFADVHAPAEFQELPLTEYTDYLPYVTSIRSGGRGELTEEPVLLLQPTSGTTAGSKLIPYTAGLHREFQHAIDPWLFQTYRNHPSLFLGRHYWSITPSTSFESDASDRIRVGFADDTEYLNGLARIVAGRLLAVPAAVSRIADTPSFQYVTLLFLLRERNLRYISIWNPSFFVCLLDQFDRHRDALIRDLQQGTLLDSLSLPAALRSELERYLRPRPGRAQEIESLSRAATMPWRAVWPHLKVISCWTHSNAALFVDALKERCPTAVIEPKGLAATEGIVSIPWDLEMDPVAAYRSHLLEFKDCQTGTIHFLWELTKDRTYEVILTTRGGLYRYQLHDVVQVTGFYRGVPCLRFFGRHQRVCDLVGEKMDEHHVREILTSLSRTYPHGIAFQLLAPVKREACVFYALFLERAAANHCDLASIPSFIESQLEHNYHYLHARRLGQLSPLRLFLIRPGTGQATYLDHLQRRGQRLGDIKPGVLDSDLHWDQRFEGQYYEV
jgi:hypothetical protein